MRDQSIFQGWKELEGDSGVFRLEDKGVCWGVYRRVGDSFIFECNISKRNRETNISLYERASVC